MHHMVQSLLAVVTTTSRFSLELPPRLLARLLSSFFCSPCSPPFVTVCASGVAVLCCEHDAEYSTR
jgi:hypothetical protein